MNSLSVLKNISVKKKKIILISLVVFITLIILNVLTIVQIVNEPYDITYVIILIIFLNGIIIVATIYFFYPMYLIILKNAYFSELKHFDRYPLLRWLNSIMEDRQLRSSRKQESELLKNRAEFLQLQSQINPHFLYNTLEAIRSDALAENVPEIANMIKTLSAFYRYNIGIYRNLVSFREELRNIVNFFTIQQYRFGDRLALEIHINKEDEACYDYQLLKLTLQPIVENAIYHGFETKLGKCKLVISATATKSRFIVTITDNGVGIEDKKLEKITTALRNDSTETSTNKTISSSTGIALTNVNRRIRLFFGDDYGIIIRSMPDVGTDVEIVLPIVRASAQAKASDDHFNVSEEE